MTGLFLLLFSFLTTAAARKDPVLPPENVSLSWSEEIYPVLTWTHPRNSPNCKYRIKSIYRGESNIRWETVDSPRWEDSQGIINGGFLNVSIQTVCNGVMSQPVITVFNDPDLGLTCAIKSSTLTRCSWKPLSSANISFFYDSKYAEDNTSFSFQECPHYTDWTRTACHLHMSTDKKQFYGVLKATVGNRTIRNVYQFTSIPFYLHPLKWKIEPSTDQFNISWSAPDFSEYDWKYVIEYTECNTTLKEDEPEKLWAVVNRRPKCSYSFTMRGVLVEDIGSTEWTPEELYGPVGGVEPLLLAVVLVPLLVAALVLLALICCMRHKETIFPKVPQPNAELFKDILNNNINSLDFCLPNKEEECHVSLVVDSSLVRSQL